MPSANNRCSCRVSARSRLSSPLGRARGGWKPTSTVHALFSASAATCRTRSSDGLPTASANRATASAAELTAMRSGARGAISAPAICTHQAQASANM